MKDYRILESQIIDWAKDKGILEKGTPLAQASKTSEEVYELLEAVEWQSLGYKDYKNSKFKLVDTEAEIKDALGDILVTIIIQAKMQNLDLIECLNSAYNVISKRTGEMVNGTFIKD